MVRIGNRGYGRSAARVRQTRSWSQAVQVKGLSEFRRELRKLEDQGLIEELKDHNLRIAEHVADVAVSVADAPQQRAAAQDLAPRRRQNASVIGLGARGRSKEWALGAEFGSIAHGQFPPWRGNQWTFRGLDYVDHDTGYFLHPAIRQSIPWIIEQTDQFIAKATKQAFPD